MCWKMKSLALCARSLSTNLAIMPLILRKVWDIIIRHNSLRNLIDSIGTDAELSPVLEKEGQHDWSSTRRRLIPRVG